MLVWDIFEFWEENFENHVKFLGLSHGFRLRNGSVEIFGLEFILKLHLKIVWVFEHI